MFGPPIPVWLFVTLQVCAVILRLIALVMFYILPAATFNLFGFVAFQGVQGELVPFHFGLMLIAALMLGYLLRVLQHQLVDFYDRPRQYSRSWVITLMALEVLLGLLMGEAWYYISPWLVGLILLTELAALGFGWWYRQLPYCDQSSASRGPDR